MNLIADVMLAAGALGVAVYCHVLARRLRQLSQLEGGLGGAIAVMSVQVDDLTRALAGAQTTAADAAARLGEMTARSEQSAQRLELLMASLHDLPEAQQDPLAGPARLRVVRRRRDTALEAAE
jgi:hypothetical protein